MEKVRQVQDLKKSNAAGFHKQKSKPAPEIEDWDDEEDDDLSFFWVDKTTLEG